MQPESFLPAIERTLQLIELIAKSPQGYTPQELLSALDVPRSTLFQYLKTLKKLGYIEQMENRGRYRSGPRLEEWTNIANASYGQDLIASFYNEANRNPFTETITLISLVAGNVVINAQIESQQQVRSAYSIGQWEGPHHMADTISFPPVGHEIIQNGVAIFNTEETWECAAPICQDGVTPNAALIISAPSSRWTKAAFTQAFSKDLRSMASRLSYQIGAQHYFPYHPGEGSPILATTEMSLQEIGTFLQGPWSARLACIRPDGRPHVVPVWQEWNGKEFTVLSWKGSYWANYLRENPNVSLTIDEPWPPFHRVVVRGLAKKEQINTNTDAIVERMSKRYMGSVIPQLVQRMEGAFSITPEQLKGWKGMASAKES